MRACSFASLRLGALAGAITTATGAGPRSKAISALRVVVVSGATDSTLAVSGALHGWRVLAENVTLLAATGTMHELEHRAVAGPGHHRTCLHETPSTDLPPACADAMSNECIEEAGANGDSPACCDPADSNYT